MAGRARGEAGVRGEGAGCRHEQSASAATRDPRALVTAEAGKAEGMLRGFRCVVLACHRNLSTLQTSPEP